MEPVQSKAQCPSSKCAPVCHYCGPALATRFVLTGQDVSQIQLHVCWIYICLRHGMHLDLESWINMKAMLGTLAFTDSDVPPATQPVWVTPVSLCDWSLILQPLSQCEWLQSVCVTGPCALQPLRQCERLQSACVTGPWSCY